MNNKKGYTLTEILMVLSILGILTGIATVSYRGYILSVNKKNLKQAGIMFATAVNTCIQSMGSWSPRPDVTINPPLPCKADDTAELKSKLSFTCPPEATCQVHTNDTKKYYCLSIKKEVSGKKIQVITRLTYNNPSDYQVWCGQVTTPLNLNDKNCQQSESWTETDENNNDAQVTFQDKGFEKGCANFK